MKVLRKGFRQILQYRARHKEGSRGSVGRWLKVRPGLFGVSPGKSEAMDMNIQTAHRSGIILGLAVGAGLGFASLMLVLAMVHLG